MTLNTELASPVPLTLWIMITLAGYICCTSAVKSLAPASCKFSLLPLLNRYDFSWGGGGFLTHQIVTDYNFIAIYCFSTKIMFFL